MGHDELQRQEERHHLVLNVTRRALFGLAVLLGLWGHGGAADAAPVDMPAAVTVINPDLAGLQALPGGGVMAWGSDASIWRDRFSDETTPGAQAWRPALTPHHGRIRSVATSEQPDVGGRRLVAVGDDGLLLFSDDEGDAWHSAGGALAGVDLFGLSCFRSRCVAVGPNGTLLLSVDGGAQWNADSRISRPLGPLTTTAVAADGAVWVGAANGRLWNQPSDSEIWHEVSLPRSPAKDTSPPAVDALMVENSAEAGVLVATADGRLLSVPAGRGTVRTVHRFARGSATRLTQIASGVWVATGSEGACAWREEPRAAWLSCQTSPKRLLRGVASSPDGLHWVLVGEGGLLLHGRPPKTPWKSATPADLPERSDLEAVIWNEEQRGFVAVGPAGLVLHGSADGRDWTVANSAPPHYVNDVQSTRAGGLLAALSHRTLARSDDGGLRWRSHRFTALQEPAFLYALHADSQRGSLVAAGGQGSVMVAPDGRNWRHHSSGHGRDYLGLLAHPSEPEVLLYGSGGEVLRVHTEAAAWHSVSLPTAEPMYHGFRGPGSEPWLVGGGVGETPAGVVMRGSPDGRQWQVQHLGQTALRTGASTPDGRALLVAGDGGALFRAETESPPQLEPPAAGQIPPAPRWQAVAAPGADWSWIQVDAAGQALWLGGSRGALARSEDNGLSWERVFVPTDSTLRRPKWDARRRAWWMPGRDGTLLRSDDDGRHWRRVFTHTRAHLKGVWIDPSSGALLLYGARLVHLIPGDTP